ncbi:ArsR/SmtB family transcription factor [Paenibacillus puldeungensis]|uniref:ArsR/SmtB family transcription factor n=1 Tax=Paenibacillus puldeungensis TaxID=696536 RepID=A0ABW3S2C5_9BACL
MDNCHETFQAVKVYKALGEPTRLSIALMLASEPDQCCTALGEKLKSVGNSTLSHHLKQLTESGLLVFRKVGTFIYFSLNREVAEKYAPYLLQKWNRGA